MSRRRQLIAGVVRHVSARECRPGGSYRLCPCGWWHWFDAACPTGHSDALTPEEYAAGFDRE